MSSPDPWVAFLYGLLMYGAMAITVPVVVVGIYDAIRTLRRRRRGVMK